MLTVELKDNKSRENIDIENFHRYEMDYIMEFGDLSDPNSKFYDHDDYEYEEYLKSKGDDTYI